jgi:hypothetical protein
MPPTNSNRRFWPIVAIGLIVASIILAAVLFQHRSGGNDTSGNRYYDPGSGETVTDPANKSPDLYGADSADIYLGFSKLLDQGLTSDQLTAVKDQLKLFSDTKKLNATEFSLDASTLKQESPNIDANDPTTRIRFTLKVNRKTTYPVVLEYRSINTIRVIVQQNNGSLFYDSKTVSAGAVPDDYGGDGTPPEDR